MHFCPTRNNFLLYWKAFASNGEFATYVHTEKGQSPRNPLENVYFENVLATALWHACTVRGWCSHKQSSWNAIAQHTSRPSNAKHPHHQQRPNTAQSVDNLVSEGNWTSNSNVNGKPTASNRHIDAAHAAGIDQKTYVKLMQTLALVCSSLILSRFCVLHRNIECVWNWSVFRFQFEVVTLCKGWDAKTGTILIASSSVMFYDNRTYKKRQFFRDFRFLAFFTITYQTNLAR